MIFLIDTHCHLHDQEWFTLEQAEKFLHEAAEDGVRQIICIGTDPTDSFAARRFAEAHKNVYWTYGIHPESASSETVLDVDFQALSAEKTNPKSKLVAIGEVGLDYHYETYSRDVQIRLFEQMLQLAQDLDLPVSLHIREAFEDAFAVLGNFSQISGAIHSFTGSKKILKRALAQDFYIGVNGLATYTTLPLPPIEKMLLETDAPFLTPAPNRGTMNMPRYVRDIAKYLANKMGVAENIIAEQTTKNAQQLFHL